MVFSTLTLRSKKFMFEISLKTFSIITVEGENFHIFFVCFILFYVKTSGQCHRTKQFPTPPALLMVVLFVYFKDTPTSIFFSAFFSYESDEIKYL
jgi:hypothetical protein